MELKKKLKKFAYNHKCIYSICINIVNHIPFYNSWKVKNGNKINCKGLINKTKLQIKGKENEIIIHPFARLNHCIIEITGDNNKIEIGQEAVCTETQFVIQDNGGTISIGNKTGISGNTHLASIEGKKIQIGDDCMLSANIVIRVGDSHSVLDKNTMKRINSSEDVLIGNHVWIGNQVCILKGSKISHNSIIGTGSIVTKAFNESNVAIAGNPASVIKSNINWCAERVAVEKGV